jgi:hypothetical protein
MLASKVITIIGLSLIFFFTIIKILNFYGIDSSSYGTYLLFYALIVLSIIVLPNSEPVV